VVAAERLGRSFRETKNYNEQSGQGGRYNPRQLEELGAV
jgi:hypothetical protein